MKKSLLELVKKADSENWFWPEARSELISNLVEGRNALDIGCGNGLQSIKLARLGYKVTGIDPLKSAICNARKNAAEARLHVEFVSGTLKSIKEKFDSAILLDVLEHVPDDVNFLKQVKKKLVPNGVVAITVPAHMLLWGKWDEDNEHYRRYTIKSLKSAAEKAGLEVELMRYWNLLGVPSALVFSRLLKRHHPVNAVAGSFLNRLLLAWFLSIENRIPMPTGVSVVMKARASKI